MNLGRVGWVLLGVATTLLVLCMASAANYSSVVVAQAKVSALSRYETHVSGLNPDGTLSEEGSVNVTVHLTVQNPSDRNLRFFSVSYSGWIEDAPAEAGIAQDRRLTDNRVVGPSGTLYFLRVFGESKQVPGNAIPSRGNATLAVTLTLDRRLDPARFDAVRSIIAFTARPGPTSSMRWNHWVGVEMQIEGVPHASTPGAAPYLFNLGRIYREVGTNLAT